MKKNMQFRSKTATVLLFSLVLLVLFIPIKTPFIYYDEGFIVFNATRVLGGDVPYKDFGIVYPPGQFYAVAAIFKAFGTTLLAARIYDTVVRFVIVIAVYLITKHEGHAHILSLLACTTTVLLLGSARFFTYPVFPALALCLLSILSLLEYSDTGQRRWLLLNGTLIGIATLFRWDIGLYAGISVVSTVSLFHFFSVAQESKSLIKALFAASKLVILVLGGALAIALPCYGHLSLISGFGNLWAQVVVFPTTSFHMRWLPYPPPIPTFFAALINLSTFRSAYSELLSWLRFYLPLATFGTAFSYFGYSLLSKRTTTFAKRYFGSTALCIFGVLLFAQALGRYDYIHVIPTSIVAFLVIVSLVNYVALNFQNRVNVSILVLLIALGTLYFYAPIRYLLSSIGNYSPLGCYSYTDRASCVYLSSDQEQAVEYIRAHTQKGEAIFVGNRRHDLIWINDIGFYFLSDRPSATSYHDLVTGVVTTLPVQKIIAHDIQSKNVNCIVLVNIPESGEPNASTISSGVYYLDDFIRSEYAQVAEFGNYEIRERVTKSLAHIGN